MKNLNTLLLLCLFTYLSFSQENKLYRTQIEGQYIVKKSLVNNSSEIIQEVGHKFRPAINLYVILKSKVNYLYEIN